MKRILLFPLLSICLLQANSQLPFAEKSMILSDGLFFINSADEPAIIVSQAGSDYGRMSAAVFKSQEYCRAELKDFEYDAHFSIVSATVYFSGANFRIPEKGTITSSSLKPVSNLIARCVPGSIVIFDEVKVIGPDKQVRTIPGMSVILY